MGSPFGDSVGRKRFGVLVLTAFLAVSFVQHLPFIRTDIQGIHAWRQSSTMWNVRNFARHDPNILNPRVSHFDRGVDNVVRLEFPIMQWGIAMFQRVFGERIEYVRCILFAIGAAGLYGMYFLLYRITGSGLSAAAAAVLMQYAPLFYHYTINPLPDVLALSLGVWYLYFIYRHRHSRSDGHLVAAGLFLLGATAAKLPYLMFSIVSIYYWLVDLLGRRRAIGAGVRYGAIQLALVAPALAWYAWVSREWGPSDTLAGVFRDGLFTAENRRIYEYHRDVLFPAMLTESFAHWPILLGALPALLQARLRWVWALASMTGLYFALEINAISTIHDYYMLPFLPWLYLLCGFGIHTAVAVSRWFAVPAFALCVGAALHTPPATAKQWSLAETYFNPDVYLHAAALRDAVDNDARAIIVSDVSQSMFSYQIDKMGQTFATDSLPPEWVEDMVRNHGVTHLYSDSPVMNGSPVYDPYKDSLLLTAGSVQVFRLKLPDE